MPWNSPRSSTSNSRHWTAKWQRVLSVLPDFLLRHGRVGQAERVLDEVRPRCDDDVEVLRTLAQLKLARKDWRGAAEIANALRKKGMDNGYQPTRSAPLLSASMVDTKRGAGSSEPHSTERAFHLKT